MSSRRQTWMLGLGLTTFGGRALALSACLTPRKNVETKRSTLFFLRYTLSSTGLFTQASFSRVGVVVLQQAGLGVVQWVSLSAAPTAGGQHPFQKGPLARKIRGAWVAIGRPGRSPFQGHAWTRHHRIEPRP